MFSKSDRNAKTSSTGRSMRMVFSKSSTRHLLVHSSFGPYGHPGVQPGRGARVVARQVYGWDLLRIAQDPSEGSLGYALTRRDSVDGLLEHQSFRVGSVACEEQRTSLLRDHYRHMPRAVSLCSHQPH